MTWTVSIDGDSYRFPLYTTRARARKAAKAFQAAWPKHRYCVVRAP